MLLDTPASLLGLDPAGVHVSGPADMLPSRYDVTGLLTAAVATAGLAAAGWAAAQGLPRPMVDLDTRSVAGAARSEAHALLRGAPPVGGWAPLSGLARARDGWVRLHANYPHHEAALCRVLGIRPERAELDAAVAGWDAVALETALAGSGGVGVAVRTREEWAQTAQGRAIADLPLLTLGTRGAGPPLVRAPRVLDLTRVIAGPVATRTLGLLGADVLRLDRPDRPETALFVDTGLAKRSALVDLRSWDPEPLLAAADVLVVGYRPGALRGLRALAEAYPQLIVVELCAWGWAGPWQGRRGFDSLVQAATGIDVAEGSVDVPGRLPAQALDHATGYLAAACAWHGLTHRARDGLGRSYRLSLAQTAAWLGVPRERACAAADPVVRLQDISSGYGPSRVARSPLAFDGGTPPWPSGAQLPGAAEPMWLPRR